MKKRGVLQRDLIYELSCLGHAQTMLLCDAGYPIPEDKPVIDLALTKGKLSFDDCLDAILTEMMVEEVTIAAPMEQYNNELYRRIVELFQNQKKNFVDHETLVEEAKKVNFVVRTGDLRPYTNMILASASGADGFNDGLDIF